jgi:hypothetical protein
LNSRQLDIRQFVRKASKTKPRQRDAENLLAQIAYLLTTPTGTRVPAALILKLLHQLRYIFTKTIKAKPVLRFTLRVELRVQIFDSA